MNHDLNDTAVDVLAWAAREDLVALYAFNYELSRAAEATSQPLIGEMRLAWWSEALDEPGASLVSA